MARGKKHLDGLDAFQMDGGLDPSAEAIDRELFGAIQAVDANRQSAHPINIHDIFPDPAQPRRAIPWVVRNQWSGDINDITSLFEIWGALVEQERGASFDWAAYLEAESQESGFIDETIEEPERQIRPLEHSLLTLIELAASIREEGLANPITVAPQGLHYLLETGERRWLAYHLLYLYTRDDKFSKIAAREVEAVNIWRQAAENNARANLNAVSKARQFAILLMDLLAERGQDFQPMSAFENEQDYYAQVSDGNDKRFRIPRNTADRLLKAMGLKQARQLRDYRALLKLPNDVWKVADDLNWTERFIRDLRQSAGDDDKRLLHLASYQAGQVGYSVPTGTVSQPEVPRLSSLPRKQIHNSVPKYAPGSRQFYSNFSRLIEKASPGKSKVNQDAWDALQEMKSWLEEQEKRIKGYLDS